MAEKTTIQQRERKTWLLFCIFGLYPPRIEQLIQHPLLLTIIKTYSWLPIIGILVYALPHTYFFLFSHEVAEFSILSRMRISLRYIISVSLTFKMFSYVFRASRLQKIVDSLNNIINDDFFYETRQELFREEMNRIKRLIVYSTSVRLFYTYVFSLVSFVFSDPGGEISGYPHHTPTPYQKYYSILNAFQFIASTNVELAVDVLRTYLLSALYVQVRFLQITLSRTLDSSARSASTAVVPIGLELPKDRLLRDWLVVHQKTIIWANDLKSFLHADSSVFYCFITSFTAFYLFSIPAYFNNGSKNIVIMSIAFFVGSVFLRFISTRIMDEIRDTSRQIFDVIYEKEWYEQPLQMQKSFSIIALFTSERPIIFKAAHLLADNSANFLQQLCSSTDYYSNRREREGTKDVSPSTTILTQGSMRISE